MKKNRLHLLGQTFTIYIDHEAIINIMNNTTSDVSLHIERLTLRLQEYAFKLAHTKGEFNISGYPTDIHRLKINP